jgi:hypothetical protein
MLALVPSPCAPPHPKGALELFEQKSGNASWSGKFKYAKLGDKVEDLEARCAGAAYALAAKGFSVVQGARKSSPHKCALFTNPTALCTPGAKKPPICKMSSSGAYGLTG